MNAILRMEGSVLAVTLLLLAAESNAQTTDPQLAEDRRILAAAKLPTEGAGLLNIFRKFIPTEAERKKLNTWVRQLDADNFRSREQATVALIEAGPMAIALLNGARQGNLEQRRRAERCIRDIEATSWLEVSAAAARLVRQQRPAGASEALLAFLPFVTDPLVGEEVFDALDHLGLAEQHLTPLFTQALTSAVPAQRAAAALVLGHHGAAEQRALARQLFADADVNVQLRAAQGLLLSGDKTAVEVLLVLLRGDAEVARRAEDFLGQLAGAAAPETLLGDDKNAQQRNYVSWQEWWHNQRDRIDITKVVAGVDLTPLGRARNLSRRLMLALAGGDVGDLKQVVDVPFTVSDISLQKWSDIEQFFGQSLDDFRRSGKISYRLTDVVSVDEYLRTTREGTQAFSTLPRQAIRVVYVRGQFGTPREETGAILVRVTGHPRVIGIGPAESVTASAAK